jgi:predicted nucleic acid-binding protein
MIVVDTNIIAYRFIAGDKTDLACSVQKKDSEWIVPVLWRHEFLNVLATMTRANIIHAGEACTIWRSALHVLQHHERPTMYERALCCAVDFSISAYDAEYIALAQQMKVRCITEDMRLLKTFPDIAASMRMFLAE